jgi:hypothetical protein
LLRPCRVPCHHVQNRREGQQGQDAGVSLQMVRLHGLSQRIPFQIAVLICPGCSFRNLAPVGRSGEYICQEGSGYSAMRSTS